ncbi:MAG: hypothetical protein AAGF95_32740 [Chloroflexota bacterium]
MEDWFVQTERVHAGILELAKGNIISVKGLVDEAKRDCRNILYWPEFDEHGNPPPLPTIKTDRIQNIPPDISME